ncbi:MAG: S9 family peptidase, partial [Candidatus Eremiobacteraeota bacterium]|nr:S9 family peptidase [Candidatus Eremiobacteraeota bacterium]
MKAVLVALLAVVSTTYFGVSVSDPYRWLENANSPRTQRWIDQQNAATDKFVAAYPLSERIAKRIGQLELTGPQRFEPQLRGTTMFYMREIPPQPQPLLVAQPWPAGDAHVVADPAQFGAATSIDFYWPSPSGKLVALGTAPGGSEQTTIRVVGADGRVYADALARAGGGTTSPSIAWDAGERGFTYTQLPVNSQFGVRLYHHVLGTPQTSDTKVLDEVSHVAEYTLIESPDARRVAARVLFGDGSFERVFVRENGTWTQKVGPSDGIVDGAFA